MNPSIFIPKDNPSIPDCYGMTLTFHNGKSVELEVANHFLTDKIFDKSGRLIGCNPMPTLEVLTFDNKYKSYPVGSYQSLELDERFSKIKDLEKQERAKAIEAERIKQELEAQQKQVTISQPEAIPNVEAA